MSFWADNFWQPGFWAVGFWQEAEAPAVEVIGVGGPQVTSIFLFGGVTEPPFAVQRRTL